MMKVKFSAYLLPVLCPGTQPIFLSLCLPKLISVEKTPPHYHRAYFPQ